MATQLITFLFVTFAAVRVTRVAVLDKIGEPFRKFLVDKLGRNSWFAFMFFCPWCIGFWVSGLAALALWFVAGFGAVIALPWWFGIPAVWFAMSYVVGWILSQEGA